MLMRSTRVQLWHCYVIYIYIYILFLSLYIINVVSKHLYIILIEKKQGFLFIISIIVPEGYHNLSYDVCMQCSAIYIFLTTTKYFLRVLPAIYCFRQPYTIFSGHILFLTAIYYF